MSYLLNVKAFFFNAKTDYLPYYKNFSMQLSEDAQAKDILDAIQAQNENFAYPVLNLHFRINDLVVDEDTPVSEIVAKLGTTLQVDPITSYRSNNGLIINNHDFMQQFELLAPYASESDRAYYKSLYALHYASETSQFERDYIGDAMLVLAHRMVADGNSNKEAILQAISQHPSGLFDCEYENNLFAPQAHAEKISLLKEMAQKYKRSNTSLLEVVKNSLFGKSKVAEEADSIASKYLAYYPAQHPNAEVLEQIDALDLDMVSFDKREKLSGVTLLDDNATLAFKKAGAILLDAFDVGAELLIVEDEDSYRMFAENFQEIESVIGRKMIGFELISSKSFLKLATAAVTA